MSTTIVKADGTAELFNENKLRNSLKKAGANKDEVVSVLHQIEQELYEGMSTEEIYRKAFTYLREEGIPTAARYSLRRALFGLGPTGFPFEDFLGRIFKEEAYNVKVGSTIMGSCVPHEIDVAAYKSDHAFVAEVKFHNHPGIKTDLQVIMYNYARKLDIESHKICEADICGIKDFMIVTNTKFTSMAKRHANCVGLQLLSWDYPAHTNLHDRIRATGLYPITVLQSLSNAQKRTLIERKIIVCSDLHKKPAVLRHLHLSARKTETVLSEARQLCQKS
ncbi:MAG: ATP cone domain-containing protein [Candidatus Paceibacterota bacterium]